MELNEEELNRFDENESDVASEEDQDEQAEENDDDDDDNDGLLSYLFDRAFLKQHIFAILVAIIGSAISYFHIFGDELKMQVLYPSFQKGKMINMNLKPKSRHSYSLKPTVFHHQHEYKRTNTIKFCPFDDDIAGLSETDLIEKVFSNQERDVEIDKDLKLFYFNFPKEYIDIMNDYFIADDTMDDDYSRVLSLTSQNPSNNKEYACLLDTAQSATHRNTVQAASRGFIVPTVDSFYMDESNRQNHGLSVMSLTSSSTSGLKPVSLTYTGFSVKFVNLSTKPMNLYWDGKNKPRLRSRIEPFESFTTVTLPGSSFFLAPLYDKEYAVQRWVATEDDALLVYDVITGDDEFLDSLTNEQRKLYMMQKLNIDYAREYLVKTKRTWLAMFPRSSIFHHMYSADYFGQEHVITSKQTHITSLPNGKVGLESVWRRLDYTDYDSMVEISKTNGPEAALNLRSHREEGEVELKLKVASITPRVFEIDNFLSDIEVDHLIQMAYMYNATEDTTTTQQTDSKTVQNPRKTTTNAWVHREYSPIVDTIYHRVADMLQIDESLLRHRNEHEESGLATHHSIAEALHLTRYLPGQGYPPRSDATQPSIKNRYQPNRFATILFFLNDLKDGEADTTFPLAVNAYNHDGVRVVPKKGKAVLFYNLLPDGNIDNLSQHSSSFLDDDVEGGAGEKWMGTLFVWDPIID
jgi:prolyl 4-hydroxylase